MFGGNQPKNFLNLSAISLGCVLLFCLAFKATAQQDLPPGISIRLEATPKKATVGDPIQLDLRITAPPAYTAEILQPEMQASDFAVLSFSRQPAEKEPKGGAFHHTAKIVAAIYKTGAFAFPPFRVILDDGSGRKIQVSSPTVSIEIQTVIGEDRDLKDLKNQADMPVPFRWVLWLAIVLACCIVALVAWRFWRRKRLGLQAAGAATSRDPLDAAESELKSLLAGGLPVGGDEKKFYILLSDIVKRILEAGYGISTAEQTTSEIMDLLRDVPDISRDKSELVEDFLGACDAVKFAKYIPSRSEHGISADNAFKILAAARDHKLSAITRPLSAHTQ